MKHMCATKQDTFFMTTTFQTWNLIQLINTFHAHSTIFFVSLNCASSNLFPCFSVCYNFVFYIAEQWIISIFFLFTLVCNVHTLINDAVSIFILHTDWRENDSTTIDVIINFCKEWVYVGTSCVNIMNYFGIVLPKFILKKFLSLFFASRRYLVLQRLILQHLMIHPPPILYVLMTLFFPV